MKRPAAFTKVMPVRKKALDKAIMVWYYIRAPVERVGKARQWRRENWVLLGTLCTLKIKQRFSVRGLGWGSDFFGRGKQATDQGEEHNP